MSQNGQKIHSDLITNKGAIYICGYTFVLFLIASSFISLSALESLFLFKTILFILQLFIHGIIGNSLSQLNPAITLSNRLKRSQSSNSITGKGQKDY